MNASKGREGTCWGASALCHVSSTLCTGSTNGGIQTCPFASQLFSRSLLENPCGSHIIPLSSSTFCTFRCNSYFLPVKDCSLQCIPHLFLKNIVLTVSINWPSSSFLRRLFQSFSKENRISSSVVSKMFPSLS